MKTKIRTSSLLCVRLCVAAVVAVVFLPRYAYADSVDSNNAGVIGQENASDGIVPFNDVNRTLDLRLDIQTTYGTSIERKDNNSSVYVNVTARPNICMLYTDGLWDQSGNGRRNCTNHGGATLQSYGKFEIYNQVNELGYPFVQVTALRTGQAFAVHGEWSPDYTYEPGVGVLNP